MSRLIKKDQYGNYMPIYHMDVCDKLYALEDIEEELGIDLITLFKALKNGIYKKGRNQLKGLILFSKMPIFSLYHRTIDNELIEDYGKTWALTKEELNND